MVDSSIVTAKAAQIEKCLKRIRDKRPPALHQFLAEPDSQYIVMFNLLQALQGCIDLAAHVVSDEGFGMAGSMNEFFYLLQEQGVVPDDLTERMVRAVGFRNLCVHEYARRDLEKVYEISVQGVVDIEQFVGLMIQRYA
jgi:uncharacterized protein YutE (UPF0331/DUF86 family)